MNWKPVNGHLIVQVVEEEKLKSGIILLRKKEEDGGSGTDIAEVVSVADDCHEKYKDVKTILFPKSARGINFQDIDGKKYRFVFQDDIIAYE